MVHPTNLLEKIRLAMWLQLVEAGPEARGFFEERAAIRQFDGEMSRPDAMQAALEETLDRFEGPLSTGDHRDEEQAGKTGNGGTLGQGDSLP